MKNAWQVALVTAVLNVGLTACGGSSSSKAPITEEPNLPIEQPEPPLANHTTIHVFSSSGNPLANATVKLLGQQYTTNEDGQLQQLLDLPQGIKQILVEVEKDDFVAQSYMIDVEKLNHIYAYLLPIKSQISVAQIQQAQVIEYHPQTYLPEQSAFTNAMLTVPANAFVRPNGELAIGAVTVEISTWPEHITDLNAVLGASQAVNQDLITAAGVFIQIKNAAGELLKIAPGQKIALTLEAAYNSLNHTALQVGQSITMWQFDPAIGKWQQQNDAQIVAAPQYKQGLAVTTQIAQLGGWQAAKPYNPSAPTLVQCQQNNQPVDCHVNYIATLADGSQVSHTQAVPATGQSIAIPETGHIMWQATNLNSTYSASLNKAIQTTTTLDLQPIQNKNWFQCQREQQPMSCIVRLNEALYHLAQDGGYVYSQHTQMPVSWHAQSRYIEPIGPVYTYKGEVQSFGSERMVINLDRAEYFLEKRAYSVLCRFPDYTGVCQTVFDIRNHKPYDDEYWFHDLRKNYQLTLNQATTIYFPISRMTEISTLVRGSATTSKDGESIRGHWLQEDEFSRPMTFNFVPDYCDESGYWWTDY